MELKRISSAFIVILAVLVILLMPSVLVTGILFTIIALIAMNEYLKAVSKICKPIKWVSYISCIIVTLINYIPEQYINLVLMGLIPSTLLLLFLHIIITDMKITLKDIAYTLLGICYVPVFLIFLSLINAMKDGKVLLLFVFIAAWATDTFAYCVGIKFGKHKFSNISPKKSIEGCIAGIAGAIVIGLAYTLVLNKNFSFEYSYLIIGILMFVLSIISQIGDFAASSIKRYVDIKDFGTLLPGHGGMLDRIDSVLFIAPFAYILFTII